MNFRSIAILFTTCLMVFGMGQTNAQTDDYSYSLNWYSFDLYHKTKVEKKNLFLSPLGTYYALLVAYEGSKNKTKQDFEKVLYLNSSDSVRINYLHDLAGKSDSCFAFYVSNAIWVDKSLRVEEEYRKSVSDKYFPDIRKTEFANTELAVSDINRWVSEKTNREIDEIVNAENINAETKLLISNAVYFKGEWLNEFDKQKTISAAFFAGIENQYKIDFMKIVERLQYFENEEYQFISKPYKESDLSFCIILPKKLFGIEEIEKKMDNDFLMKTLDNAYHTKTSLSIPKIKLTASYELSDILKNAGLKSAFTKEADFSGLSKETPLMLGQILHKTRIELDEEKTLAAAVTAAVVKITGQPSYKIFKADHPFIFFIIDNSTKAILFMGRYVEPTQGEKIVEDTESLTNNLEIRKKEKFAVGRDNMETLYVVDKKIISQAEFNAINPENIESIKVIKSKEEISKYSSGNYDGALIITLKKRKNRKRN